MLVEFALILPVLALLLFGIAEFGIAFNNLNNLRQGTREGARQGVVATPDPDTSCPLAGVSPNTATRELMCTVKDRVGLDPSRLRVQISFPTTNAEGESMLVCTHYPLESITGMFSAILDGGVHTTEVLMRIETADEDYEAAAETPVGGTTWDSCG